MIGDSGFVTNNKKEFIYKVKKLLDNKKDCVDIGKRANQRARRFDWDIIAKKTIHYYNEVGI